MPVGDYCERSVVTATPRATLRSLAKLMKEREVGSVVLEDEGLEPPSTESRAQESAGGRSPEVLSALSQNASRQARNQDDHVGKGWPRHVTSLSSTSMAEP